MKKTALSILSASALTLALAACSDSPDSKDIEISQELTWDEIVDKAKGQKVYFNAWGGSETINDYISWAAERVKEDYGVEVEQVKVTETGNVVSRILAEKTAGRNEDGSVDLVWINGENFKAMKENELLAQPYTQLLPNYELVDTEGKPTTVFDFTTPVDNMEAPWGMAQLVFMFDSAKVPQAPGSITELMKFAADNPGRVTYPAPPSFHGTTFIKQALLELADDASALYQPVDESDFEMVSKPLWDFLDQLHPTMWRGGEAFTQGADEMKQLLNDGEILISLSFNPNDASNAIANQELPDTVRTYVHNSGTIGNTHFVAIPYNSSAKAGAMVFSNFLMSAEAQARKANPEVWGDPTVLAYNKLDSKGKALFDDLPIGVATLSADALGTVLREPHTSWVAALENEWQKRYLK